MKIILTTLFDHNMREVGAVCRTSLNRFFGSRENFEIVVFESLLDSSLAPSWNKILAVRSLLGRADWVFWVDADCVVHREPNLAELTGTKADFRPSQDYNGINCGVFLIRNSPWSARFLDTLLFLGDVRDDRSFGRGDGCKWEQNAVKALQRDFKTVADLVEPLPDGFVSNTTSGFRQESFIHHAYAMGNPQRFDLLCGILERIPARKEACP